MKIDLYYQRQGFSPVTLVSDSIAHIRGGSVETTRRQTTVV